jgi:hypothetical protein
MQIRWVTEKSNSLSRQKSIGIMVISAEISKPQLVYIQKSLVDNS